MFTRVELYVYSRLIGRPCKCCWQNVFFYNRITFNFRLNGNLYKMIRQLWASLLTSTVESWLNFLRKSKVGCNMTRLLLPGTWTDDLTTHVHKWDYFAFQKTISFENKSVINTVENLFIYIHSKAFYLFLYYFGAAIS